MSNTDNKKRFRNLGEGRFINKRNVLAVLLMMIDIVCVVVAGVLAVAVRFDFDLDSAQAAGYLANLQDYLLVDISILIGTFLIFGLYTSIWAYASVMELARLASALIVFELVDFSIRAAVGVNMPRSFFFAEFMLLFFSTGGIRFASRVRSTLKKRFINRKKARRTLVVGGGDAARLLINEIINNPDSFDNRIVAVIDDDRNKVGKTISGIPVVGTRADIEYACYKYGVEEIIIAIPSAKKKTINAIVEECQKASVEIRVLPRIAATMSGDFMRMVRPLSYEDFLGRDEIVVNPEEIRGSIMGKTVLVTGGGGSIGSELCRQIAKMAPRKLIILDIYENNAYDIQQELLRDVPGLDLAVIIRSVRDYAGMEKVFQEFHPQIVFHAAAHKHVPLMEYSPNEAIKNNCFGTWNTCKLADKYACERFVLISSDKAVRPTNVMGASKRICEMIVQAYARSSEKTEFVAVRFGNVLGSNGSVIPLFLKQIAGGGPVTVTHPDMTRYFMTIPEAVSLILQAGVYAGGGEIFILDMGKPVRIYDLAEKLIRMRGYEPGEDIEIRITGLRPGEKIFEELLMEEEGLQETPNKLIHIGKPIMMDDKKFFRDLKKLCDAAQNNDAEIKDKVAAVVGTYTIDRR